MSDAPNAAKPTALPIKEDTGPRAFLVSSAPHLASGATTQRIMFEVIAAMLPILAISIYLYRLSAIILTVVTVAGCLAAEAVANWMRGHSMDSLKDGSAIVTGMILAFSLPPSLNPYMAFIGGVVAIALAKAVFGGIGHNLFNPAMVGRAFLMICFPAALANWTPTALMMPTATQQLANQKGVAVSDLSQVDIDAITTATPLYQAAKVSEFTAKANAEPGNRDKYLQQASQIRQEMPTLWRLALGNVGGCVGETSALLALICGLWLVLRGVADWRQPLGMLVTVFLFALVTNWIAPDRFQSPAYHLTSGALMFAAFFIVTDYVGAPVTPWGRLIFGIGVGLLVMIIRIFGAYPEGVMFAVLIMNAVTPLVERVTTPTPFGGHVPA